MKKPALANPTDELIETLFDLQKLAADAQSAKLRAVDLRKAYELLREHRPNAKCTKACLDEVLAVEYEARTMSERLVDRMKSALLSATSKAQAAVKEADEVEPPAKVQAELEKLSIYEPKRGCQRKPHVAVAWLEEHTMEFPRDQWIAVDGFELVASDPTIAGLMQKLEQRRVPFAEVCILYNESLAAGVARAVD